ncbi:cysteine desulfurase [Aliarcobacter butzleri]|uniref:Cysteine desulfurase n=1 Tax=Aliarcobacter butzleri L351 TaxID=1447259 RepID=A0A837J6R8_9BACT|nr:cysteine desulfurase [Aliarcobacter butzleri]KLE01949.1 cysteine desulfurase [Aliarcobacter butzleri L351]KLE13042.1 cysteine desulfurase [Aliarcobacter butzleri L350]MDN5059926.1 cysteine desulfurase [Aliarcobacter butzleri]MDN5110481.1 cysteine desulfurase [Aliarcobacter butzleri]
MIKLNNLQYNPIKLDFLEDQNYSLDSLVSNFDFDDLCKKYKEKFAFSKIKTFSFSKEGFLGLFLELKGKIAVSFGECEALIQGAKLYESLGFELTWIDLNIDGSVNYQELKDKDIDFLFLSSYVMDTFFETSLDDVKNFTNAKIISNGSAKIDSLSDIVYFDNYKLCGYSLSGVILFNDENIFELLNMAFIDTLAVKCCFEALENQKFNYEVKEKFLEKLKEKLKDNIYFFVDNEKTLPYTLHFALKNIKAREIIRTLAFDNIFLSNGEGCSLGLSKPSRIIQAMGYDEMTSRNAISLNFLQDFDEETILKIVDKIEQKYKQIRVLD